MSNRIKSLIQAIRNGFARITSRREPIIGDDTLAETVVAPAPYRGPGLGQRIGDGLRRHRWVALGVLVAGGIGYGLYSHPPVRTVEAGETGIRINRMTGDVSEWRDGTVLVLPALHQWRTLQLRDQTYRPGAKAGDAPFQSVEGLSFGADLVVRYAVDSNQIAALASKLPDNIEGEIVEPAVQGVIFKVLARYTVREIFSSKRAEIQQTIESELKPRLAADGIVLRAVQMGKVDLPDDYRRGMEKLLAEELERDHWGDINPSWIRAVSQVGSGPVDGELYDAPEVQGLARVLQRVSDRLWDQPELATTRSESFSSFDALPAPTPPPLGRWELVSSTFQPLLMKQFSTDPIQMEPHGRLIWTWKKLRKPEGASP